MTFFAPYEIKRLAMLEVLSDCILNSDHSIDDGPVTPPQLIKALIAWDPTGPNYAKLDKPFITSMWTSVYYIQRIKKRKQIAKMKAATA